MSHSRDDTTPFDDVRPLLRAYEVPEFDGLEDRIMARLEEELLAPNPQPEPRMTAWSLWRQSLLWGGLATTICMALIWLDATPQQLSLTAKQAQRVRRQQRQPKPQKRRLSAVVALGAEQQILTAVSTLQIACMGQAHRTSCLHRARQMGLVTQLPDVRLPRYEDAPTVARESMNTPITPEDFHSHTQAPGG